MEYLVVRFPELRHVIIDGTLQGETGELIELEAGTYKLSLAPPPNFRPDAIEIVLEGTSPLEPLEVIFDVL